MKHILLIVLVLALTGCKSDKKQTEKPAKNTETQPAMIQQKTTYYFIRHAEKDRSNLSDTDPELTKAGLERAGFWADFFSDRNLESIYSTKATRCIQTAIPTLDRTQLELNFYEAHHAYSDEFLRQTNGKTVLIVGHQDSLVQLINKILDENKYQKIPAEVYGNLYKVVIEKDGSKSSSLKNLEDFGAVPEV